MLLTVLIQLFSIIIITIIITIIIIIIIIHSYDEDFIDNDNILLLYNQVTCQSHSSHLDVCIYPYLNLYIYICINKYVDISIGRYFQASRHWIDSSRWCDVLLYVL
jgi:hypothetical protein